VTDARITSDHASDARRELAPVEVERDVDPAALGQATRTLEWLRTGSASVDPHQPDRSDGPLVEREFRTLQRLAGNAAVAGLVAPTGGTTFQHRLPDPSPRRRPRATAPPGPRVVQRAPPDDDNPEASRPMSLPESIVTAITLSDFRSISVDDIADLNDDQLLELKRRFDTWKQLYDGLPEFLHEEYRKARGKSKRQQAYDLFMASAKITRAFKVRYEPVTSRAEAIGRQRGFSISGAAFGPKPEGESEFDRWSRTISEGLGARARDVFAAVLPEVKRRLEFLLWDIDYPEPGKSSTYYWRRYGYWNEDVIHHRLIGGERRTEWSDFAPFLGDAARAVAVAFDAAIAGDAGPESVIRAVESVTGEINAGVREMQAQADGVIGHGIEDVNIRDLYRIAEEMRDTEGSVMACFADGFLYG
jgi:hypothetical protein